MENLQEKIQHEGCGICCETIYLLERLCKWRELKDFIFKKIEERSQKEFVREGEVEHKETFKRYGAKDCTKFDCHAPYVLRALIEEEKINDDYFEQIKAINDHRYYLGQKLGREVEWNEVAIDWVNNGFAKKFREEYCNKKGNNSEAK